LPGRLDGTTVVVVADPRECVRCTHAAELSNAGEGGAGAADAAAAYDFDAPTGGSKAMGFLKS
jgi:hypothetical protein